MKESTESFWKGFSEGVILSAPVDSVLLLIISCILAMQQNLLFLLVVVMDVACLDIGLHIIEECGGIRGYFRRVKKIFKRS